MRDAGREFAYVRHPREAGATEDSGGRVRLIDARPAAQCAVATLAGARCLPADELFAPGGRLPAARDLLWLLGASVLMFVAGKYYKERMITRPEGVVMVIAYVTYTGLLIAAL